MSRHQRHLGPIALLFASVGGILGSGWLFGPLYAVHLAGPAALLAWIIGGAAILVIALTFAELGAMHPVNGGITRHALISYGRTTGFLTSLVTWLTFTVIVAAEIQAVMQYASIYLPFLTSEGPRGTHPLTGWGFLCAAVLWIVFSVINYMGIRFFARVNSALTWVKIGLVILVGVALIWAAFSFSMFDDLTKGGFAPYGLEGVFEALAYGGVIYAYTGFQHAAVAAGESKNPSRDVPLAILISITLCTIFYLFIQLAFIGALRDADMSSGWASLAFQGQVGPLAGLALTLGLTWLFYVIFVGAIISPSGAGLINLGSSVRVVRGMSHDSYIHRRLGSVGRFQTPGLTICLTFPIGLFLFLPFPGWQDLVAFLASVVVFSYALGPLCLMAMRRQMPEQERPFRLPLAPIIAPLAFVICGLLIFWAGWTIVWKLGATLGFCTAVFIVVQRMRKEHLDLVQAIWALPFLGGLVVLTLLGGRGGIELIPANWDILVVSVYSLLCYGFARCFALPASRAQSYLAQIHLAHEDADRSLELLG